MRPISYRAAGYAWDLPQSGGSEQQSRQHLRGGRGTVPVQPWREFADLTAA